MMWFRTLRARFAIWTASLMLVVLTLFGIFVYLNTRNGLSNSIDDSLRLSAKQAMAAINFENGQLNFSDIFPEVSQSDFNENAFTIRVLTGTGNIIQAAGVYQNIPVEMTSIASAMNGAPNFYSVDFTDSDPVRIYTTPIIENQKLIGVLQVMESLSSIHDTLDRLLITLLISIPVLLIISALSGYFLATRALNPIDKITQTAKKISTEDLSARLNLNGVNDEIGRMATTFDGMLARLEDGFKRERQFTSNASHELRTPLAAMQAILNVTREKRRTPDEYELALDDLSEETDRLRILTENLLYIARGDSRPIKLDDVVDLSNLLIDICESLLPMANLKDINIFYDVQQGLFLLGDQDALIRAFVNLIDNAIKYTAKGEVRIQAKRDAHHSIIITISDTGFGIPEEQLQHIFKRFYRVEESRSTDGFGLGLAIVHQIVSSHKGSIEVSSDVGEGTTFKLTFNELENGYTEMDH